ncbi:MAG: helix-turn-helix transcriptional regulator [Ruminococcus sp.]|nr:helix-turn-helix transcriptional regulator [Ruminococcus sp.]
MKIIDQEKTRKNIVELRIKHNLSQNQLAEALGASRTHYNGIENGKTDITKNYINTLAEFYEVPVDNIVVYSESYDAEYYDVLKKFNHLMSDSFDSLKSRAVLLDTMTFTGKKNQNILATILYNLGYTLEIKASKDVWNDYFILSKTDEGQPVYDMPRELLELFSEGYVIALKKTGKTMCYLSVSEYLQFENYLIMTVKGFTSSIINDFKKFTVNKGEPEEKELPLDILKTELERITELLDSCREAIKHKEGKKQCD